MHLEFMATLSLQKKLFVVEVEETFQNWIGNELETENIWHEIIWTGSVEFTTQNFTEVNDSKNPILDDPHNAEMRPETTMNEQTNWLESKPIISQSSQVGPDDAIQMTLYIMMHYYSNLQWYRLGTRGSELLFVGRFTVLVVKNVCGCNLGFDWEDKFWSSVEV